VRGLKIMRNAGETTHFHACVKDNYVYVGKGYLNVQDLYLAVLRDNILSGFPNMETIL
jgi:hypothetical protein